MGELWTKSSTCQAALKDIGNYRPTADCGSKVSSSGGGAGGFVFRNMVQSAVDRGWLRVEDSRVKTGNFTHKSAATKTENRLHLSVFV